MKQCGLRSITTGNGYFATVHSSSGLFTAPTVSSATPVNVTATSQADSSKSATMALTVNPAAAVLTVNPASLSFSGQAGATDLTGQREHHKYWGWHAYLHGGEQPALVDALSRVWNGTLQPADQSLGQRAQSRFLYRTGHRVGRGFDEVGYRNADVDGTAGPAFGRTLMEGQRQCKNRQLLHVPLYHPGEFVRPSGPGSGKPVLQRLNGSVGHDSLLRCDRSGRSGAGERLFQ